MLYSLVVALLVSACVAENPQPAESAPEAKEEPIAEEVRIYAQEEYGERERHRQEDEREALAKLEKYRTVDWVDPLKDVHHDKEYVSERVLKQDEIIKFAYSPIFYEPTVILDYRFLKTGGRDYTRGPGGQILILPKGIRTNEKKEFENYDQLLEYLRLKELSEKEASKRGRIRPERVQEEEDEHERHNERKVPYSWQRPENQRREWINPHHH